MNELIKRLFNTHVMLCKLAIERNDRNDALFHLERSKAVYKANKAMFDADPTQTITLNNVTLN
jgi:hypothetical protein